MSSRILSGKSVSTRRPSPAWRSAGVLLLLAVAGCGGGEPETPRGDVSGTVTHEGRPVTEGNVYFFSRTTGQSASAPLDENGQFTVVGGVEVGPHVVTVSPPVDDLPPAGVEPAAPPKEYPNIPAKYRSDTTSDLVADVKAGDNEFTFELQPSP